jgi:hypothetical protein
MNAPANPVVRPSSLPTTPPITSPVDAEVDLEVLKVVPRHFEIVDEKTANWLVRKIVAAREYGERVKEWAERERRRADREEHTLTFLFGRQIETWAKTEIEKLNGRRKSLCLPAGTVGFRSQPSRLVVDDDAAVILWAKKECPAAIVVVEKLSRSILNDHFGQTGEVPEHGAHVERDAETFYIR